MRVGKRKEMQAKAERRIDDQVFPNSILSFLFFFFASALPSPPPLNNSRNNIIVEGKVGFFNMVLMYWVNGLGII